MKKHLILLTFVFSSLCGFSSEFPINDMLNYRGINSVKKIVLDPGHGGHDSGAVGEKYKEKDIVLNMALILGKMINMKYPDVEVIYTRTTDVFIPLHERTALANKQKADLFISIHCNAISNPNTKGSETFVMGLHRAAENLEVAKRENSVILLEEDYEQYYEGFDPNSPVGHIMLSAFQDIHLNRSIELASTVEKALAARKYSKSRGVKQAGFAVLRRATMPSILIEAGFMSNREEEIYLGSDNGQLDIANALLESVESFGNLKGEFYVKNKAAKSSDGNSDHDILVASSDKNFMPSTQKSQSTVHKKVITDPSNKNEITSLSQVNEASSEPKYRIQIAALQKDMTASLSADDKISKIGALHVVKDGNLFKYQVGDFSSSSEAKLAREKLIAIGYSNSFLTIVK
jgi:N-acetylmuramoyl-L-alanine amidase